MVNPPRLLIEHTLIGILFESGTHRNIMKKEDFYTKYPLVFNKEPEIGFYCGAGWFELLDCLFLVIQRDLEKLPEEQQKKFEIVQIKEKFGRLTIYYNGGTDYIKQTIEQAESMSEQICETCGEYGYLRDTSHWLKVRCDSCENKHFATRVQLSIEAKKALDASIQSAKEGPSVYLGSFAKYADDE